MNRDLAQQRDNHRNNHKQFVLIKKKDHLPLTTQTLHKSKTLDKIASSINQMRTLILQKILEKPEEKLK